MATSVQFKLVFRNGDKKDVHRFFIEEGAVSSLLFLKEKIYSYYPQARDVPLKITWIDHDEDEVNITSDEELVIFLTETISHPVKKLYVTVDKKKEPLESKIDFQFVHSNIICDGCEQPVVGFRYKCVQCDDYDLCFKCEGLQLHKEHVMLRIPNADLSLSRGARRLIRLLSSSFAKSQRYSHCESPPKSGVDNTEKEQGKFKWGPDCVMFSDTFDTWLSEQFKKNTAEGNKEMPGAIISSDSIRKFLRLFGIDLDASGSGLPTEPSTSAAAATESTVPAEQPASKNHEYPPYPTASADKSAVTQSAVSSTSTSSSSVEHSVTSTTSNVNAAAPQGTQSEVNGNVSNGAVEPLGCTAELYWGPNPARFPNTSFPSASKASKPFSQNTQFLAKTSTAVNIPPMIINTPTGVNIPPMVVNPPPIAVNTSPNAVNALPISHITSSQKPQFAVATPPISQTAPSPYFTPLYPTSSFPLISSTAFPTSTQTVRTAPPVTSSPLFPGAAFTASTPFSQSTPSTAAIPFSATPAASAPTPQNTSSEIEAKAVFGGVPQPTAPSSENRTRSVSPTDWTMLEDTDSVAYKSLQKMLEMGFTNENNWLLRLLESTNGNIMKAMELMSKKK